MIFNRLRVLPLFLCLYFLQSYLYAQEKSKVQFGKVSPEDFNLPASPAIDSNTNAVIISDHGETHFIGNAKGWFSYVFKRQTRIKIINKKAFELATVKINLYFKDDDAEKTDKIEGSTYNLENGSVVETKLDKKDIFGDKLDKNHLEKKFTMPAVKEGSIIEYTYTKISNYEFNIPSWEFQSISDPVLWSEYEVAIPQTLTYVQVRRGIHSYYIDKGELGNGSYRIGEKIEAGMASGPEREFTVSATTIKHRWVIKDVPALNIENYLSSPANYIDRIEFQLAKTSNGETETDVMNSWKKANEDLLKQPDFGGALRNENYWLNNLVNKITENITDPKEQARAIYYYVNSHFTCTNHNDPYIRTKLEDILKTRNGTVGEINLLLIAMLRKMSFTADPVLLSTRAHGFNTPNYFMWGMLNYVIVRLPLSGKIYYLDAARPKLGFGQLSPSCYNGHARIISERDSGSVYFYADSLRERKMTMVLLTIGEKGKIEGSYQSTSEFPGSYNIRERVHEIGQKEYFKSIQTSYGGEVEISNTGIDSLDMPEMPLKVSYDLAFKQAIGEDFIYINPIFADPMRENPFKALDRKYPVEMNSVMDQTYVFSMEIPNGYKVDEVPKSARVALNGNEGSYEYLIAADANGIQLRTHIKLNRADFTADDYKTLRDFFGFIVKKESEQIVLKKK